MSREAGEFEKGDILDANTTTELVNSVIEAAGNNDAIVALTNKVNTAINDDGSINVQGRTNVQGGINIPSIEFVDLGLPSGTLWMKCNIGAEKETDYGLYFQWGDTVGHEGDFEFTWSNCPGNGGNSYYNEPALSTWDTTNLTNNVLNTSVDPVYAYTNGRAKMPTKAQFEELCNETDNIWTTINGVAGRKFISRKDYSTFIFFPASGCRDGSSLYDRGYGGYYWTSTLNSYDVSNAYNLYFHSNYCGANSCSYRYLGMSVRGVASTDPVKLTLPSASGTLALASDIEAETARAKAKEKELDAAMAEVVCVYGVRHYYNNSSSALTRIGASNLHVTLPVQSLMRRCVLADDGSVVYYLDANDSTKKEDGTDAVLDGTDGQVMVEIPEHYRRHTLGSDYYDSEISLVPFTGAFKVNKYYVSMSEAAMDRTNNKLSSVVNTTAQYRGGNNTSSWDDTYRSLLGMPATAISTINYHTYANNRGDGWEMYEIDVHDDIYWLYVIEYANLNV